VSDVASRPWPAGTEFEVLAAVHSPIPVLPSPAFVLPAAHVEHIRELERQAVKWTRAAAERIRRGVPGANVTTKVREGVPKDVILDEAREWRADRIILGNHGHGALGRLLLGSVAEAVVTHAPCSVEVIRGRSAPPAPE
jgi:nucleotide-binding universal stress UspA family protein